MSINYVEEDGVYAKFNNFPYFQKKILEYLFPDEDFWKLLYYLTPNALDKQNLTTVQKQSLVYRSLNNTYPQNTTNYRVFLNDLSDDLWPEESAIVRITLSTIVPENKTKGTLTFDIDVLTHIKIDTLDSDRSRKVCLLSNILGTLNGADIKGVGLGKLAFSRQSSYEDKAILGSMTNGKNYSGYKIVLSTHYAADTQTPSR